MNSTLERLKRQVDAACELQMVEMTEEEKQRFPVPDKCFVLGDFLITDTAFYADKPQGNDDDQRSV